MDKATQDNRGRLWTFSQNDLTTKLTVMEIQRGDVDADQLSLFLFAAQILSAVLLNVSEFGKLTFEPDTDTNCSAGTWCDDSSPSS